MNLVVNREEVEPDSIYLAWYSGIERISSSDVSDHEYDSEVVTRKVAYTLPRVGHPGNDVG